MKRSDHKKAYEHHQRGGAMLVMLVILVMGITTVFVSSLSNFGIKNERNQRSIDALSIAKDTLIGRAVSDDNLPGSLPCPDSITNIPGTNIPNDGIADLLSGTACPSYIGRLPWKTLGISDLRDGSGERLWYALSPEYRDTPHSLNSETTGSIWLTGTMPASNLVAIVFAPGQALSNQSRISANQNNYAHYLENATPPSSFQTQSPDDHSGGSYTYNDQIILISVDDILSSVEMRIAREGKQCLDAYASAHSNKYPWAAHPANTSYPYSESPVMFGRFPKHQTPGSSVVDFIDALSDFQTIVAACAKGTGNQATLVSRGEDLKDTADYVMDHQPTSPAMGNSITSPAKSAGDDAKDGDVTCAEIQADPMGNAIQIKLNQSLNALNSMTANFGWPANCTIVSKDYWNYWRNQLFYQISTNYKPSGSGSGAGSITINSSGNYRAAVILARKPINAQVRNASASATYLESPNDHTPTGPATGFMTEKTLSNASRNDLVLCLDGNPSGACQ